MRRLARFRIDDHADHRARRTLRDQRPEQPDRIGSAAGAWVVLDVGEDHRPGRGARQAQRLGDGLVGVIELAGEIPFARADRGGEAVGGGLGGLAVMAVHDQRRAAIRDIGRRKSGGMGDRDDTLVV
jgi:hypothetical protein